MMMPVSSSVYTIGHSTRSIQELLELLQFYKIQQLIDVRAFPSSKRYPWFNKEDLRSCLEKENINYLHLPNLGGRRKPEKFSINKGWRNSGFRGFADYMQTQTFKEEIQQLLDAIKSTTSVIMCAESVPWRCHRSLIADALLIRGLNVLDIISIKSCKPHSLTKFAVVNGHEIYYPLENLELDI